MKDLCRKRIEYFVAIYLSKTLELAIPDFHIDIYSLLIDNSKKRLAIIAPTGFGKSSTCIFAFPLYLICYVLVEKIILLSASSTFAERRLRNLKSEIENNKELKEDFNISPGSVWRNDEITIMVGDKEISVLALGKGSQITGERADVIVSDDIETELEAKSEIERASLLDYWYRTVMNRPTPEGRIIQIGSISNKLAWLNRFTTQEAKGQGWEPVTYKIEQGRTLWKEKWSDEHLAEKKRELAAVPGVYEALYEANTSKIQKYTFQSKWMRYYETIPPDAVIFCAVDPAVGEKLHNDYTAIVVGAIDLKGKLYLIAVIKKRFNVETLELFGALFGVYDSYKPIELGFESVAFQKYVKVFFQKECLKVGKFPKIKELNPESNKSKVMRISSLAFGFEAGDILVNKNMPGYNDFLSEYEAYPEVVHDDVLDAVSMLKDMAVPAMVSANTGSAVGMQAARGNE